LIDSPIHSHVHGPDEGLRGYLFLGDFNVLALAHVFFDEAGGATVLLFGVFADDGGVVRSGLAEAV